VCLSEFDRELIDCVRACVCVRLLFIIITFCCLPMILFRLCAIIITLSTRTHTHTHTHTTHAHQQNKDKMTLLRQAAHPLSSLLHTHTHHKSVLHIGRKLECVCVWFNSLILNSFCSVLTHIPISSRGPPFMLTKIVMINGSR